MAKKKTKEADAAPTFESAVEDLQTIVQQLENGELSLEESLSQFEKGTSLLKHCFNTLESAEQRIELLTGMSPDGETDTVPFDASSTLDQNESSAGRRKRSSKKSEDKPSEPPSRQLFDS